MTTNSDFNQQKTPPIVIAAACGTGTLGACVLGFIVAAGVAFIGSRTGFEGITVMLWAIVGAAIGISFTGLVALIVRNELSRNFSYPFLISFMGSLGFLSVLLLEEYTRADGLHVLLGIGLAACFLGVTFGSIIRSRISAFREAASKGATILGLLTLLLGIFMSGMLLIGAAIPRGAVGETFWFLVLASVTASVAGGVVGALIGALRSE